MLAVTEFIMCQTKYLNDNWRIWCCHVFENSGIEILTVSYISKCMTAWFGLSVRPLTNFNKKAFQFNVNHPLADNPFPLWTSLNISGGSLYIGVQVEHVRWIGALYKALNRQIDRTENITFRQLRWRVVILNYACKSTVDNTSNKSCGSQESCCTKLKVAHFDIIYLIVQSLWSN